MRLLEKLKSMESVISSPSRIDQLAMKTFMESGHWYRHIRRIRRMYRKKYEHLTQLIQEHLSPCVQYQGESAGLHIELIIRTKCDSEPLISLALGQGIGVYGPQIADRKAVSGYAKIYLGFGGVRMEDMEQGILLLKRAWSEICIFS